jgi:hypothetical protein
MKQGAMMLPSGKRLHSYGKIHPFLMGKSTINGPFSIATLNYQRVNIGGYPHLRPPRPPGPMGEGDNEGFRGLRNQINSTAVRVSKT